MRSHAAIVIFITGAIAIAIALILWSVAQIGESITGALT